MAALARRGKSSIAARRAPIVSLRLTGMIDERITSFGALSDTARLARRNPSWLMKAP